MWQNNNAFFPAFSAVSKKRHITQYHNFFTGKNASDLKERHTMNIYVGNLPYSTTREDLEAIFGEFGAVQAARVVMDRESGRSKGFGFVEMDDESGKVAIEKLNGSEIGGRKAVVNEARPREERPRTFRPRGDRN